MCSVPGNNIIINKVKQNSESKLRKFFSYKTRKQLCHSYKTCSFKRVRRYG